MKRTGPSRLSISFERQHGLAGSNLADQDYQALAYADPVKKGSVGLLVNSVGVKEAWVRGKIEGLLSKAEIGVIHLLKCSITVATKPRAKALHKKFFVAFWTIRLFFFIGHRRGRADSSRAIRTRRGCTTGQ